MATKKEVGFIPNAENLKTMHNEIKNMTDYNPSNAKISVVSVGKLLAAVVQEQKDFKAVSGAFDIAVDARENAFANVKPLATRIQASFTASTEDKAGVATLDARAKALKGIKLTKKSDIKKLPELGAQITDPDNSISQVQQGFDDLVDHLNKVIEFVASHPDYAPNEPDLMVNALKQLAADLQQLNDKAGEATTDMKSARRKRNKLHLASKDSVYDIQARVKKQVLSTYKARSAEYAAVKGLRFKSPRKNQKAMFD